MNKFKSVSRTEALKKMMKFRSEHHPKFSNLYSIEGDETMDILQYNASLVIFKNHRNFRRIYFMTNDLCDLEIILRNLEDDLVVNVPYKKPVLQIENTIKNTGFLQLAIYKRLYNKEILKGLNVLDKLANKDEDLKAKGYELAIYPHLGDAEAILQLLQENFSEYTDYIPSKKLLEDIIKNKEIVINKNPSGKIVGFIIFKITGVKCYQNFWLDKEGLGLYLMKFLYRLMDDSGILVTNFWVNSVNTNVLKIHSWLGAKEEGTYDVTFLKSKNKKNL